MQNNIQNKWEYVVPVAFSFSLILACIIVSRKTYFWMDELLSFYFVHDPSFTNMLTALSDTINSSPPLYFVLGWIWSKIFTASELSLRLFSSLAICFAQAIVWLTLRRTYNFWATSLGTLIGFVSIQIVYQNSQARFYGLFIATCALGLMQFDLLCRQKYKYSHKELLVNVLVHIAIIYTHFYGFIYSGATLLALIISDTYFSIFRPKVYLSFILAWLTFIPWLPAFVRQSALGTWMAKPSFRNLLESFNDWTPSFFLPTLLVVLCLILLIKPKGIYNFSKTKQEDIEIPLLILAFSWLSVSVFTYLVSIIIQPIFLQRYLIPSQIGWSIVLAFLFSALIYPTFKLHQRNSQKLGLWKLLTLNLKILCLLIPILLLIAKPLYSANQQVFQKIPGVSDYKYNYQDLPIVVEFSSEFLERYHYYHNQQNNPYFFLLDREIFLDKTSWRYGAYQYKLMYALRRNYSNIFGKNIVFSQDFLKNYHRFLVLYFGSKIGRSCPSTEPNCHRRWFDLRIENNAKYRIKNLGVIDYRTILLVESK